MGKRAIQLISVITILIFACTRNDPQPIQQSGYQIINGEIQFNQENITLNGVNALHSFGLEDLSLMQKWKVQIVREFIGNLREQPIAGSALQGADGTWLHPLDEIVTHNRAAGMVTILCPFGWVNENGEQLLFTGLNPNDQHFFDEYLIRMREIAIHFSGQDDVWLEVWNEPYHWNNENNYTHALWLSDMQVMINNLRSITGFDNIIVVPGNEQGQSEDVILTLGHELLSRYNNIIFDLHAYEKWLEGQSEADINQRFQALHERDIPFLMGEIGVRNVGDLMDPASFLSAARTAQVSTLAWLWKREALDQSALLNEQGEPNDLNNNQWGSQYKEFLRKK